MKTPMVVVKPHYIATTGKEDGSVSGLMSAGPRGRDGVPERPSCKYPASIYSVPGMLGRTVQSNKKKQSPFYTLTGRSKIGGLHQDLQKV